MERTLRRRCGERNHYSVKSLVLFYRKDVHMECWYADGFIALANAHELILHVKSGRELPDDDAGAWCAWSCRRQQPSYKCCLTDFLLTDLPSLEHLHIGECTIAARHQSRDQRARRGAEDSRVSCKAWSYTNPMTTDEDKLQAFCLHVRFQASFTTYSSFRLRAPRLQLFKWSCTYADEVCIESVGHLSYVVIELAAGLKPRQYNEELSYVTLDQRDKLMTDILQGLMPGLRPLNWDDVKRYT
ncbi:hypothetical protein QOZ80_6AG0549130 [Eleusine coracana subsp. coracana]|nr:hypothetical protein QOZ80_6AG0549130 [Eleusine coracana subsp. coracana]